MATITLSGVYGYTQYRPDNLATGTIIDAETAIWYEDNDASDGQSQPYPVVIDNGTNIVLDGGTIDGRYELYGNTDWRDIYSNGNSAAIHTEETPNIVVQDWRISDTWDAIRTSWNSDNFLIQGNWLSNVHDDAFENDKLNSGTYRDNLIDGALSGFSLDPSSSSPVDGSDKSVTIDHVLLRMQSYLIEGEVTHGSPFKPDSVYGLEWTPQLHITNTVVAIEDVNHNGYNRLEKTWPNVVESSGNVYLNLSDDPLPADYPVPPGGWAANGWTYLEGAAARSYWANAKAGWISAHDGSAPPADTTPPTVSVALDQSSFQDNDLSGVATFTFSETPTGFTAGDVSVTGGTLSNFAVSSTDNKVYTATLTAPQNSTTPLQVSVAAGVATDAAGNNNTASNTANATVDTVNPTATVNIVDTALNDADPSSVVNFTFSEAVNTASFAATATNGALSGLTFASDGLSATATFTATDNVNGTGSVTVTAANDLKGNTLAAQASDTVTVTRVDVDTTPPTGSVNIVDTSLSDADPISNVTFTFSEAVNASSVATTVSHGTLSALTWASDSKSATATFTAEDNFNGNGSVTLTAAADAAGNNMAAPASDTVAISRVDPVGDTTPPTATVNIVDTSLSQADYWSPVNFTFSEAVNTSTFTYSAVGGTISDLVFAADRMSATAGFTANGATNGTGSVTVTGVKDDAGNNLAAQASDTVAIDTVSPPPSGGATTGNDTIIGTSGNDSINALAGNDQIWMKGGNDTVYGGPGQDTFVFDVAPNATTNVKYIKDFNAVDDQLFFENAVFTSPTATGTLSAPGQISASEFEQKVNATGNNDYLLYEKVSGKLWYDQDGSGTTHAKVLIAQFEPNTTVTYLDAFVI